jgi:hypothetical protein
VTEAVIGDLGGREQLSAQQLLLVSRSGRKLPSAEHVEPQGDDAELKAIDRKAKELGLSRSEFIREGINLMLAR